MKKIYVKSSIELLQKAALLGNAKSISPRNMRLLCATCFRGNVQELPTKLLYRDTIIFQNEIRKSRFSKIKLQSICFSTFKYYSFDKVEKPLPEAEYVSLKN